MNESGSNERVIIETRLFGEIMKVTAVDPQSLLEVSFQVPRHCARIDIQKLAMAKLDYVRRKNAAADTSGSGSTGFIV